MPFKQGYALVVGVGTHQYSPENDVPITVRDAESVEAILAAPAKCGYPPRQVLPLYKDKATRSAILAKLDDLAAKVTEDSTLLVFFAGHGALGSDHQYYLVTHDTQFVDGDDELLVKPGTGVSQVELLEKLRAIKARRAILIFNACHSGNLQPKSLALRRARKPLNTLSLPDPTAAALLGTGEGRIIITACRPDQLSHFLEKNKLTYFTRALTDGLSGKAPPSQGFISAFSLYTYVYAAVTKMVSEQEPMITVLQGVGPFAVALHQKKTAALGLQAADTLPEGKAVRTVTRRESQKWLTKIENQTIVRGDYVRGDKVGRDKIGTQINTGGGAYVRGGVKVSGGSFVGRDQTIYNAGGDRQPESARLSTAAQRALQVLNDKSFTQPDLADLCISIGVDWDSLEGRARADKVRTLVAECERSGKLDQLRSMLRLARPKLKDQL